MFYLKGDKEGERKCLQTLYHYQLQMNSSLRASIQMTWMLFVALETIYRLVNQNLLASIQMTWILFVALEALSRSLKVRTP